MPAFIQKIRPMSPLSGGPNRKRTVGTAIINASNRFVEVMFVGIEGRFTFEIADRLDVWAAPGIMWVWTDNLVEKQQSGFGILLGGGLEYYVLMRHFSVGLDLNLNAPVQPFRLFLSIGPTIKYTF